MDHTSKKAIEIGIIKLKGQLEEKMMWVELYRIKEDDKAADKALAEAEELLALIKKKENKLNPTPSIDEPPSTDELLKMFERVVGRPPKLGSIGEEVSRQPEPGPESGTEQSQSGPDIETEGGPAVEERGERRCRDDKDCLKSAPNCGADGFCSGARAIYSGKRKRKRKQTRKTHKRSKHKHKKSHKPKKTLKRKYKNKSKRR